MPVQQWWCGGELFLQRPASVKLKFSTSGVVTERLRAHHVIATVVIDMLADNPRGWKLEFWGFLELPMIRQSHSASVGTSVWRTFHLNASHCWTTHWFFFLVSWSVQSLSPGGFCVAPTMVMRSRIMSSVASFCQTQAFNLGGGYKKLRHTH